MPTKPAALTQDQTVLALHRLNPLYVYNWTSATEYEWRGLQQPDGTYDDTAPVPTDQQLTDAWAAYEADPNRPEAREAERDEALSDITTQYAAAYARMVEIADDPNATDLAGEVRGAVRDVARVTARLMRYLKAQAT